MPIVCKLAAGMYVCMLVLESPTCNFNFKSRQLTTRDLLVRERLLTRIRAFSAVVIH